MIRIIQTALELGFGYAPVAIALFLSYRILDIADLSTDGCFVLGAAVSVSLAAAGHPLLAIVLAMLCGAAVGCLSAELQTYFGIPSILAGIIVNTFLLDNFLIAINNAMNTTAQRMIDIAVSTLYSRQLKGLPFSPGREPDRKFP